MPGVWSKAVIYWLYVLQREKTYLRYVRPAKIQISLRIRAVWSESTLAHFR